MSHASLPTEDVVRILKKHDVARAWLFGSAARGGDFGPDSDLDLIVQFRADASPTYFTLIDIADDISALVGRDVDVISRRALDAHHNDTRRRSIERDARPIFDEAA